MPHRVSHAHPDLTANTVYPAILAVYANGEWFRQLVYVNGLHGQTLHQYQQFLCLYGHVTRVLFILALRGQTGHVRDMANR